MKTLITILTLSFILFLSCTKKEGCMDPQASNYDNEAKKNCCCEYETTTQNKIHSGFIINDEIWSNDVIHELAGKVVVENGATLTIEPGTIIKGRSGIGSLASALIISKGSKINAQGTYDSVIIFTSVLDNIEVGGRVGTNLDKNDLGKWGGVIILGNAPVSTENGDVIGQIEGIPAGEDYGLYGGVNELDNSGVLTFCSIRHGGALIGEGNEINGLTLGGVGEGTTINNIEVVANLDDGVELFGGTVNVENVLVSYQGDDGIDIDQNYSGEVKNFIVINDNGDEGLEIDGPEGSTYVDGMFTLSNGSIWTTNGNGSGSDIKSKAQGVITNTYWSGWSSNSIKVRATFTDTVNCIQSSDAYQNLLLTPQKLELTQLEVINPLINQTNVYTKSMSGLDCIVGLNLLSLIDIQSQSSPTVGNQADFSWTYTFIVE